MDTFFSMDIVKFLAPEAALFLLASLTLLLGPFFRQRVSWAFVSLLAIIIAYYLLWAQQGIGSPGTNPYTSPVLGGPLSNFIRHFSIGAGMFLTFLFWEKEKFQLETSAFILILSGGCSMVGMANDLTILYIGLELVSIPSYIMLYCHGSTVDSSESTMKYFFLSIFSSAFLLFGLVFLYGITGTTNISAISDALLIAGPEKWLGAESQASYRLMLIPLFGVLVGLGFKVSIVPFHFYAPDVYQGAGNRMCAVLALMPKIAGFAGFLRIFGFALDQNNTITPDFFRDNIPGLLWVLALLTITLGNILALLQRNVRRILAYSSIAHSGYILAALAVAPKSDPGSSFSSIAAALFYLVVYFFSTFGIFAILDLLEKNGKQIQDWDDLAGTAKENPLLAFGLAIFLFSLTGIPLTGGFLAKLGIIYSCANIPFSLDDPALLETRYLFLILALAIVLNAAIGAWYYLKLVSAIFLKPTIWPGKEKTGFKPVFIPIGASVIITVVLGIYPSFLLKPKAFQGLIEKRPIALEVGVNEPIRVAKDSR